MRHSIIIFSVFLIGLMMTSVSVGQDIGDYGSVGSGNWGSLTTWAKWDGTGFTEAATTAPSTAVNVYIRTGHTVTVESSGKNCKNLFIQEAATLVSNTVQPTSSIVYVRVAGTTVQNNGTIGTLDNLNTISFEPYKNLTFEGTGVSRICRVRPRPDSTNLAITFDTDVTLTYTGGSGTGGVGIYSSNNSNNDNITININPGKTVTCVNYCYVAIGSSGTGDGTAATTFNINGNLVLTGPNTNFNLRSSKACTLNVNGSLTVGKNFNTISAGGIVPNITVNGELIVSEGNFDLSAPASLITGSGTVNVGAGATLLIGPAEGISTSGATGAIQTTTRIFSSDAGYTYSGNTAQITGNALPLTLDDLRINNPFGVTLNNNVIIDSSLILNAGVLTTGSFSVKMNDGADIERVAGHVNGLLTKTITGGGTAELFDIGDAVDYSPITVTFGNITTPGLLTASATAGDHPDLSGSLLNSDKNVNRYFTLANNGIIFDNYSAVFNFKSSDVDAGADTAAFFVQRYNAGTWFTTVTANPLAASIEITGEVLFGDFAIGEEKPSSLITDYFRSKGNGNWNDFSTWESSSDNLSWIDATVAPYDTANTITIRTGDTVTVVSTVNVNQLVVEAGSELIVTGDGTAILHVSDGAEAEDMIVFGTVTASGTAPATSPFSVNALGVISFESGSEYVHAQNAGGIPISTWKDGSTIKLTGTTNTAPSNRAQDYFNLVFDTPGLASNLNMGFNSNVISGDITVVNTGSSRWQLLGPVANEIRSVTIMGDIIQTAGQFSSHGSGTGLSTAIVHTFGNIVVTGGNFSVSRGSQSGTGTTDWYLHGNLSLTDATTQNSNAAGAKFIFTGDGVHNLTLNNSVITSLPIQVDSATLHLGTSQLKGSGIFTISPTSVLGCANEGGLDSALQNTGTTTLSSEADYLFNGTAAQITGAKLPASVHCLVVNNLADVTLTSDVEVSTDVNIIAGNLIIDNMIVTLGSTAELIETGGNVLGTDGKITTTRQINTPNALNVAGMGIVLTTAADLGLTTVERIHSSAKGNGNSGINRIFHVSPVNNSGLNATLGFYYLDSELNTIPEANLKIFSSLDGIENNWELRNGTINTSENFAEITGLSKFSYWTLADVNHPIPVEMVSFAIASDQNAVILSWSTSTESQNRGWDIERRPANDQGWVKIGFTEGKGNSTEPSMYQFKDKETLSGKYQYRLKQIDYNGTFSYSDVIEVEVNTLPSEFALYQNYPNPFNPETVIRFDLPEDSFINLSVYNSIGEKVITLVNEKMEKGRHSKIIKANNLSSGIYIYRLSSGNNVFTRKMILIK